MSPLVARTDTRLGVIACEVWGDEGRPWVVLSAALGTDRRLWRGQVQHLADRFRVLAYDHPGHGQSTVRAPVDHWHVRDLADSVLAVLDSQGVERCTFVGLSLGGAVGMQLALDHPGRIERLACCCARADSPEGYSLLWASRIAKVRAAGMQSIVDETLAKWFVPEALAEGCGTVAEARRMLEAADPLGYAGCAGALMHLDLRSRLPDLAVACHFLAGDNDAAIPPEVVEDLHALAPHSRYTRLAGAGHLANLDQQGAFNGWLDEWLAQGD